MYDITASAPTVCSPSLEISVLSYIPSASHWGSAKFCNTLAGHTTSIGENP